MKSDDRTPDASTERCECGQVAGDQHDDHACVRKRRRTADDPFGCCGGNDEKPPFHCSDCPTHPWTDEPSPLCMTAPTACPHARASASAPSAKVQRALNRLKQLAEEGASESGIASIATHVDTIRTALASASAAPLGDASDAAEALVSRWEAKCMAPTSESGGQISISQNAREGLVLAISAKLWGLHPATTECLRSSNASPRVEFSITESIDGNRSATIDVDGVRRWTCSHGRETGSAQASGGRNCRHGEPEEIYCAMCDAAVVAEVTERLRTSAAPTAADETAEAALEIAIALAEEGWGYASEYFREKWRCEERIQKLRRIACVSDDEPLPTQWAEDVMERFEQAPPCASDHQEPERPANPFDHAGYTETFTKLVADLKAVAPKACSTQEKK